MRNTQAPEKESAAMVDWESWFTDRETDPYESTPCSVISLDSRRPDPTEDDDRCAFDALPWVILLGSPIYVPLAILAVYLWGPGCLIGAQCLVELG